MNACPRCQGQLYEDEDGDLGCLRCGCYIYAPSPVASMIPAGPTTRRRERRPEPEMVQCDYAHVVPERQEIRMVARRCRLWVTLPKRRCGHHQTAS
jgi:hypothetical protein